MDENLFKQRTKQLALRFIDIVDALPKKRTADVIGRQLIRSGTSIGANYRAACRGKSTADVIAKLRIVEEEADESAYWMELLIESGLLPEAMEKNAKMNTNHDLRNLHDLRPASSERPTETRVSGRKKLQGRKSTGKTPR